MSNARKFGNKRCPLRFLFYDRTPSNWLKSYLTSIPIMLYFYCFAILFAGCSAKNITSLNLSNSDFLMIKRETFNKYRNLEELNITNSRLSAIADGAFYDLPRLAKVDISNNALSGLSHKMFRPFSKIQKLVVSHNMLGDIGGFDIGYLPELATFDISHNQIRYLPRSLLDKVERDNFTLISTSNPWDCRHGKFCGNLPPQASFVTCVFWITGAFWCGIVTGNLCLIRRILFRKSKIATKREQGTQYDTNYFRELSMTNYFRNSKVNQHAAKSKTDIGTSKPSKSASTSFYI